MDDAKRELVRVWLIKARNDFDTARQIGSLPGGHLDTAIYHCQQAAEKVIKGYLAFRDHDLERTHDLRRIIQVASHYSPEFSNWMDAAITLTPYATAYCYPGESAALEPSRTEFDEALRLADGFMAFVFSLLPVEVQPGK
ncbi:MAG: HEPN domain-containing protein [Opitutaceae bacterium]